MGTTYDLPDLWAATLTHRYGGCNIGVFSTLEKAQEACQTRDEEDADEDAASLPMIWKPADTALYEPGAMVAEGYQEGDEYIIEPARLDERAAAHPGTAERRAELLMKYGRAKFGDEWWPGNATQWAGTADRDGQVILTAAEAAELEAYS